MVYLWALSSHLSYYCLLLFSYLVFLKFYQLVVHFKLLFMGDILLGEPSVYLLTPELGLLAVCELLLYSIHLKMIHSSSLFCLPPLLPFFSPPFSSVWPWACVCVCVRACMCVSVYVCLFLPFLFLLLFYPGCFFYSGVSFSCVMGAVFSENINDSILEFSFS